MTKPEREVAIHLAVRLGPACSPAVPLAAHSDVLLLQGATSGHSRSAVGTVPWAPRRRPTAAGHGGRQLAGSVSSCGASKRSTGPVHARLGLTQGKGPDVESAHLVWPSTRWETIMGNTGVNALREPWNKGKIVGQKAPFKLKDIWALRVRFQMEHRVRELALFNLGIDSKLRGCDLVALKVRDVCHGDQVATRAIVLQHKTQRPVQFEITPATRDALQAWIKQAGRKSDDFIFPSRLHDSPHLGTRQYARILGHWVNELGLDHADYGTHSMRRTKATLIYRRTKNLRAMQLLLGHSKLESTVRYLGIEVDDALEISEQTEI